MSKKEKPIAEPRIEYESEDKQKEPAWISKYKKEQEEVRKKAFKEKGYAEFLTIGVGETKITVDPTVEPRDREGKFGEQVILRVRHGRKDYDLSMSKTSPCWRQMLEMFSQGKFSMTIVQAGTGRQKRQSIKEMA